MSLRDLLEPGNQALAVGNWSLAKKSFEAALDDHESPEALDGLGQALWWLKEARSAIEVRARAYIAYKLEGRIPQAAMLAVWLARELRTLFRNDPAADGWLARAETLSSSLLRSSVPGWIALARAEATRDVAGAIAHCTFAIEEARTHGDADLEIVSLGRIGLLQVAIGEVELGVKCLDEAMAAASAGEASNLQNVGYAYCALLETAEMLGDRERFAQWTAAIRELRGNAGFGPLDDLAASTGATNLSAFCGACCGGVYLVTGRLDQAESELLRAIADLAASGMASRCVHPATQLAELKALQGRFEEARKLLEPYEHLSESVRPLALIELGLGSPDAAAVRLRGRLKELRDLTVATLPLWTVLVDAEIARGELNAAGDAARRIAETARLTGSKRHRGEALFAEGKVAAAHAQDNAADVLRKAARTLSEAGMALTACRARLVLAQALVDRDRPEAISEARSALAAFDRLGALPDADEAAAFLRSLGVRGRTGPKNLELLSKRELEVLRLITQGLTNAEAADRLFISVKTAGHHVSNILSKLGLRSRTEAAAYAALHLGNQPAPK